MWCRVGDYWLYSSISTDDCRGFWNSCTLYLPVQHTGTYANIHPICSPFLCIRLLYKDHLNLDSAICSGVCGTETGLSLSKHAVDSLLFAIAFCGVWSGSLREGAAERDGGEGKDKIFGIKNRLKNIIENMSGIMIGVIIETIEGIETIFLLRT